VIIGVARDIKTDERRVALLPEHVKRLIEEGHSVWVEAGAGEAAGFNDEEYAREGAEIVSKEKLYEESGIIVKVKCPMESEYRYLRSGQLLFAYLHFDENIAPENIKKIASTGVTALAYEWVEKEGDFPLLRPMSELAGILFALRSMDLLMQSRGMLPGGFFPSLAPPSAMIIGIGRIGANALKVALMNNMNIVIVDKHPETLEKRALKYIDEESWRQKKGQVKIIKFNNEKPHETIAQIATLAKDLDVIINCAVRRADLPKSRMEYLITQEMVSGMKKGSVVCDATACDRDLIETAVSSERLLETYELNGVIHYNCDHIPSLVPQAASILLANAVLPYVQLLANEGFEGAIGQSQALVKAVMCHQGFITHEYTSKKKNLAYKDIKTLCRI
jgi:alanine dehydrogenase